ncbi:DUF2510 domain-containing protein [Microlunatus soli]|uniref:DUF2510 domain-containing protein n=1 Tax=Microlunatus soli TaxID=630515 RepID=A0A1H1Q3D9_9ACTN|nr:DUF2510 domain-containing protein [Microlunatus soli]SDS17884.1 Protein of unknown function [Microlunatus soli]
MAATGWYPDPGGATGRYRYWDGSRWSAETTDDPTAPPPTASYGSATASSTGPTDPSSRPSALVGQRQKSRTGIVVGALVVLVVLILAVVFTVRAVTDRRDRVLMDPDPPQSSVSGWDDSSPLPTETPTPTQSAEPSDSASPQGLESCPDGDPSRRQNHPADDKRTYGGDLSFPKPAGYDDNAAYTHSMTWAYDTDGVYTSTEPAWASLLAVGYITSADGFKTTKQSADGMMQCIASSGYYSQFTGRKDVFSKKVTVDGHPGWALRSEIRVDNPDLSVEGDVAEVIVVDTGTAGQLSFFGGFVPIGDQPRIRTLDDTIAGLQVG